MDTHSDKASEIFLDFLLKLLKRRKFIFFTTLLGLILSIVIALILPKYYIAYSSIKGASSSSLNVGNLLKSSGAFASLGSLADFAMPSSGGGEINYLTALLNSQTVQDSIIKKFKLLERYRVEKIEDAREVLKGNTVITPNILAEIITLGIYDKDPAFATQLTEYYIEMLNKVYTNVNAQAAKNSREHLENRYRQTFHDISVLEDSMEHFQEKYRVYSIDAQTQAAIKSAAELKSELVLKEIDLGIKEKMFDKDSPEIKQLKIQIAEINKSFNEMIDGTQSKEQNIFIPFSKTPELALKYVRLYREIQIQTELLKIVVTLLEQAKIQEKRETPSILVIDKAIIPTKKAKPLRFVIAFVGFFGSFVFSIAIVLILEHVENIKVLSPQKYQKILTIYTTLKQDFHIKKR
ncbi:MAG: hypothetical protein H3C35_01270 [Bacteroidetes bacterium]|nr:hypothetical protein [Bacteroidota bacterium]